MWPKKLGGLGVPDLESFTRTLCLRWLWFKWTDQELPWLGMEVPCNEVDKQFFRASTEGTMGDGSRTSFWEFTWLGGRAQGHCPHPIQAGEEDDVGR